LWPKEELDLERFLENEKEGAKFKFISLKEGIETGEIDDPSSLDNGVINVRIWKELQPYILSRPDTTIVRRTPFRYDSGPTYTAASIDSSHISYSASSQYASRGVTTEGSHSGQTFTTLGSLSDFNTVFVPNEIKIKIIGEQYSDEKYGLFWIGKSTPLEVFNSRRDAFDYAKMNKFGLDKVSIEII